MRFAARAAYIERARARSGHAVGVETRVVRGGHLTAGGFGHCLRTAGRLDARGRGQERRGGRSGARSNGGSRGQVFRFGQGCEGHEWTCGRWRRDTWCTALPEGKGTALRPGAADQPENVRIPMGSLGAY
jgi:hypothetical protein